jgi:glycosyltransferase involved in cell wall biosynthesis
MSERASPLHVLVVHNRYRSGQPSGEDAVVDQERALLAEAGHAVETFGRSSDDIARMSPARRATVPLLVPWNPLVRSELAATLRRTRPDVVHVHNTFPLLSPAVVAACSDVGVPLVATLHNYLLGCPSGGLFRDGRVCTDCVGSSLLPAVRHGCYRNSRLATVPMAVNLLANQGRWFSGVTRFFCISAAQRDTLVRAGLPTPRVIIKPNFVADPGRVRSGPGSHLLFVGRLNDEKGVRLLMAAWDDVAARGGLGLPLVMAGAGQLSEEVARWASERTDVRFLGLRTRTECAELMQDAAAIVVPSVWREAFGMVVVEAMAAGVPAVAAGHGGLGELVQHGATGLLHEPGDRAALGAHLCEVVRSPDRNREMGESARRRYERGFTPKIGLANLVDGYREAIRASAESSPEQPTGSR